MMMIHIQENYTIQSCEYMSMMNWYFDMQHYILCKYLADISYYICWLNDGVAAFFKAWLKLFFSVVRLWFLMQ